MLVVFPVGAYAARTPRYRTLFGAVSITSDYRDFSRQLMVRFFRDNAAEETLARMVKPRKPFRRDLLSVIRRDRPEIWQEDLEELSSWIAGIERDGKGVPILLKQYLKLGGKVLSFNVDPHFGNALDGLIVVDLLSTDPRILKRYMGAGAAETFLGHHLNPESRRTGAPEKGLAACANG